MDDVTLEEVLARKYDIQEKLIAEGEFVALCGADKEAVQLTAAGISSKSFIIATVNLSGEQKDYELNSITALSVVELAIQNFSEKKISVKSQYKATRTYQLCSGEDQETVWGKFVKIIDSLQRKRNISGDTWRTVPFEASIPLSGVNVQSSDFEHSTMASDLIDVYHWRGESDSGSSISSIPRSLSARSSTPCKEINLSRSTSSLPETHTENFTLENQFIPRRMSADQLVMRPPNAYRHVEDRLSIKDQTYDQLFKTRHSSDESLKRESIDFLDITSGTPSNDQLFKARHSSDEALKRESIDFLDITSGTPSVFSECENTLVINLESESEPESFQNRSNNFLTSNDQKFEDLTSSVENSSKKTEVGFLTRMFRRLFCCKKRDK